MNFLPLSFLSLGIRSLAAIIVIIVSAASMLRSQPLAPQTDRSDYDRYVLHITKATGIITIDGNTNEAAWQQAQPISNFFQHYPVDSIRATSQVEVRALYDERFMYFSFFCSDSTASEYFIQSLRRDFDPGANDGVAVFIDPLGAKTNGFAFGVTPAGVQREGFISFGGLMGIDQSWDNIWVSEVSRSAHGWSAEVAIPFKSIRFESNKKQWRINFARWNWRNNELATWTPFPQNFRAASLAHTGILEWDVPPSNSGVNLSIIPSVVGIASKNYAENTAAKLDYNIGADVKYGITSSLNLDLTINPDFSTVNADRQVTNLQRFSLFFPEQRQFFIENSDIFSSFGFSRIRPFFSRRIGLADGRTLSIPFGVRLSGNISTDMRVGVMNIQTASRDSSGEGSGRTAQNYTVAAAQYQVFGRSTLGAIFVNRQGKDFEATEGNDYNRLVGLDFNYSSRNGFLNGKIFYHRTITPENKPGQFATAAWLGYSVPGFSFNWNHEYVGENHNPEVGFVPRTGVFRLQPDIRYTIFPQDRTVVNQYGIGAEMDMYLSSKSIDRLFTSEGAFGRGTNLLLDRTSAAWFYIDFANTSGFNVWMGETFTKLTDAWDVTGLDKTPLPVGEYHQWRFGGEYYSDKRSALNFNGGFSAGGYFVGSGLTMYASVNYRIQPYGSISINIRQDNISLPEQYNGVPLNSANFTLVGTQLDFTPTRDIFLNAFIQYNTQASAMNINTRLQWRFAPMSDLFFVYTDNYGITSLESRFLPDLQIRNRGVALKLTYWFNT